MQAFGAFDGVRGMLSVLREVSLDEIREQAETPPRVLIVGPTSEAARRLGLALTGAEGQFSSMYRAANEPLDDLGRLDAAVVWDPDRTGAGSRVSTAVQYDSPPVPIVRFEGTGPDDERAIEQLRLDILRRNGDRVTGFGRALPAFRQAAARQVIDETSIANAQFSIVSNLPALIPIIGGLAAAGADFIVLTKNQVIMLYKLAAIYGRNLNDQRTILQEVLPVVGAGLVWRTLAREASAVLPFAAGAVPKLAIAYAGTVAVGRAAEYYYRTGLKPTRAQMDEFTAMALERMRRLNLPEMLKRFRTERDQAHSEVTGAPQVTVIETESRPEERKRWRIGPG
ncbi:MAG: hypothetical protein KC432_07755 [Thermomicrobiales bacterium]|nr:hypothetical protein [Thermomicrobiales bacterium]